MEEEDIYFKQRREYYEKFFPLESFYKWLTRDGEYKATRELSLTTFSGQYIRYLHFDTPALLLSKLKQLNPTKFDIGAVFNKLIIGSSNMEALKREFVIDIDMDDYADVRYCCSGAKVCDKCWTLIVAAAHVLNYVLREHFGFEHILNVFSGRRGLHVWSCDEVAMNMTDVERMNVMGYLGLYEKAVKNEKNESAIKLYQICQLYDDCFEVLLPFFEKYLEDQEILTNPKRRRRFLQLVPLGFRQKFEELGDNLTIQHVMQMKEKEPVKFKEVVFTYLYPRMDTNVSIHRNHLLKSPFCLHPSTGNVCVAIPLDKIHLFPVEHPPNMRDLVSNFPKVKEEPGIKKEKEDNDMSEDDEKEYLDYTFTDYVQFFTDFVNDLVAQHK